LMIVF